MKLLIGWGLREERVPFQMGMGGSAGDDKTGIVEEGTIGDESSRGSVSVRG